MQDLIGDYEPFIENVDAGLKRLGIRRKEISTMDHVCYRVESYKRYAEMKAQLAQRAFFLDESEVSGRMIATYEFDSPLEVAGWRVPYLELPQPKKGSPHKEGLEYAGLEVVGGLDRFRRYHMLPFDEKAMDRPINPELRLKYGGISVRFHELQLGAVCRIKQQIRSAGGVS